MSATVETNQASWRKRLLEDDATTQMDLKRPRYYYYRLESESSKASEEDTESVYSLQDRETDVVKDTTDTDSKSGNSDEDEYEVHYEEYEVASLSGSENGYSDSSDSEGMMLAAAAVAICDSSLETWITDCEDSDNSSDETSFGKTDFSICIQCKSDNDNPLYRYCEKCFQDRKKFYPPRPKRNKKSRKDKKKDPPVELNVLRSCLKDLSPDSGIGSSQEWPVVDVFQIVMQQKHPTSGTSKISTKSELNENVEDDIEKRSSEGVVSSSIDPIADNKIESQTSIQETKGSENSSSFSSANTNCNVKTGRKRHLSESSLSDFDLMPHQTKIPKIMISDTDQFSQSQKSDLGSDVGSSSFISSVTEKSNVTDSENLKTSNSENSELCMFCQNAPKDAIFLHTKVAHQCCCYKCAKRTIKTRKRCPICNVTVNKVYRVIKS